MAATYGQFCAVASALDVVGDRWTLLLVRELLAGPRRYGELTRDLPGIATNLLAGRLRDLEAAGLVAPVAGAGDGRTRTYRLTAAGEELRPVVEALARFGLARLPDDADGLAFRPQWLVLALEVLLVPEALDADLVVRFDVRAPDTPPVWLRLGPGGVAHVGPDGSPDGASDVVVAGDPPALVAAVRDAGRARELVAEGRLAVTGDPGARRRLAAALGGRQNAAR
ncbi:winged helix-turn-helix transcriptional regulator [Actinomycetospora straminea]|uniref:Winged helix-turn-helix transcriptional regulator n=1 Tax=Actinomycetospora straminea TaxID=663607 RepID=A0ABP9EBP3_9PSEU|nr:winged helix-turn-helix transcriptional regulator [Actinomycetospora straminea]MDD7934460.1 winged helix-turn-helix transcriptional regulator [Actinomycetospora straminea]